MSEMTHTPTPWEFIASAENDKWIWIGPSGWETRCARVVLYDGEEEEQKANAAYIVHCVNSHASLVEENKRLRGALEDAVMGLRWGITGIHQDGMPTLQRQIKNALEALGDTNA